MKIFFKQRRSLSAYDDMNTEQSQQTYKHIKQTTHKEPCGCNCHE